MSRNPVEGLWKIDAVGVAVCAALGAGAFFAGFQPLLSARAQAESDRRSLAEQGVEASRLEAETKQAEVERDRLKKEVAQIQVLEPPTRVNQRVNDLADLAARCGLRIGEIGPGAPYAGARFTTVPIRIKGAGSYRTIADFFGRVGERFRDTAVVGFRASCNVEADQSPAEFAFDLEWYAGPAGNTGVADASSPDAP